MATFSDALKNELPALKDLASAGGINGFFGQEVLRFYSVAGTLSANYTLDESSTIDERYITHILTRSLLENYFWILYLFDDESKKEERYMQLINAFKREYKKLLDEPQLPHKDQLEPAEHGWSDLPRAPDVRSMLAQIHNDYGDRLDWLYFVYRITSFDTHGKNLDNVLQATFGKPSTFPILDLKYTFQLMVGEYLSVLRKLREEREI